MTFKILNLIDVIKAIILHFIFDRQRRKMSVDIFGDCGRVGPPGPKGQDGALIDPTSSYETYITYINLRKKTSYSIRGIVKIKGNQKVNTGYIDNLLESPTLHTAFYWDKEPFQDKYIEFIFDYPVWIKHIELLPDREITYNLHFIWQQSNDGIKWEQIGKEYNNAYKTSIDPYYQHTITFSQNIEQGKNAKHWRMYGLGGCITDTAWIRALFITLTL